MNYGYIRVSTDKQDTANQRFEINRFCEANGIQMDRWMEDDGVSGTVDYKKRKIADILKHAKKGDTIIVCELSRLGRELFMIMEILRHCMERGINVWTIKEGYRLGNDIQSKVLAFAFGLSAEIERNLISQRTKEALARKKSEGVHLGRPHGAKTNPELLKLHPYREQILDSLSHGKKKAAIAREIGTNRHTLTRYLNTINF